MSKKLTLNITAARREELLKNHLSGISDNDAKAADEAVVEPVKAPVHKAKKERIPNPLPYFNYDLFSEWLGMFRAEYPLAFPQKKRLQLAVER